MSEAPTSPDPSDPPLDRTISPIAGPLTAGRGKAVAFAGLLVGCGAVALATWSAEQSRRESKPRETPARQVVAFEPAKPTPPTLANPGSEAPSLAGASEGMVPAIEPMPEATTVGAPPTRVASPRDVARRSPLIAYSRNGLGSLGGAAEPLFPSVAPLTPPSSELDQLRHGSSIRRVTAAPVGDRNFLILAGASIPCVLQTAIDTTAAGYVSCLIDRDIYSDNGAVVLLEKGARVLGEYRTGMRQGQNRVFVLWTRAVTPKGVAITLSSPGSDALGRAGFGGAVDTHFWDRFGAAILLSVIDGGTAALSDNDSDVRTVRMPSDAAGLAVRQAADIAPTLRAAQGAEIAIQVAQDLDFSTVYRLRARP
ncbi:MAG: hypothetical protein A2790_19960 [Phenylobacterium sp. RIFCSPHIGHO2_01_FULL_69_31]|uniref:type IV secretion system protein VirB10 n=1 Tax=Phenylobacterium sp. RIFCSPHIGHO2_01_FULL_69_31 TaxID=1801944 RepID=UPI0008D8460F|nr:type IV secretion system protein VirB10 [Phenylobacterium sp. RIFCSPHIGHO2_01_FULL_69_31]OHB26246.1 MAG: hypothetical protein A2790_19960 [Phenylobacterium sp. RIFCSPHIGHO2_01_FULL_69_31]